ncbi:MAG TPA: alpha/beta hydrolase [Methanoregula sp.]|nr:alpha/beta hydrolase [Methanoregula sp.]
MHTGIITAGILVIFIVLAGCTGNQAISSYSVDSRGILSVSCAAATTSEEILFKNDTYTKTRVIQHTETGDVVTYLAAPPQNPKAAIVYVPGAGEKPSGHEERMVDYARAGYAFLFVDIRGNAGETPGYSFNPQQDFYLFEEDDWPQYYLTVCDLVTSQEMLSRRFGIPVYAMGSSNGGRYAAVAAGVDPAFAGFVGISTSDWGVQDAVIRQGYTGNLVRFAASIEPGTYFAKISPRPVWIFHDVDDPVIPFENGKELFERAGEPKTFIEFSGGHGINPDVDNRIIMQWAQIYGT